jgi:D-alanine-D-alanine ligase
MSERPTPVRLIVLYGGQSAEHDVSRVSAASLLKAIDTDRYDIEPVAIGLDGTWHRSDATLAAIDTGAATLPDA